MNFSPKRAAEVDIFTANYTPLLMPGETILEAEWSITPVDGDDSNAASMIQGGASIAGPCVSQLIGGGAPGVTYAPICTAQTSLGRTLIWPDDDDGLLYVSG